MSTVLIVHGGRFGQSEKIANQMRKVLEGAGHSCDFVPLTKTTTPDPARHQAFLLVTSVRYGYFDKNAYRLIENNRAWLEQVPAQVVTVSLTARKPEKRDPQVHSYTKKFLEKSGWKGRVEVVAGALEYPRYSLFDRLAIQLIMRITNGPTDPSVTIEYTDWEQVDKAAAAFAAEL
ncbi:MAG: menaquinone-dependent protoporphyrinogen IX dehydrogenase [Propionibacteriaceae bacterium]|nr:menaquinone-dependent protoporphyrinogen IX dehydrogenase [Propionibacteriaceae bacterium]